MARRLDETEVTTYAVDPGTVDTTITQHWGLVYNILRVFGRLGESTAKPVVLRKIEITGTSAKYL